MVETAGVEPASGRSSFGAFYRIFPPVLARRRGGSLPSGPGSRGRPHRRDPFRAGLSEPICREETSESLLPGGLRRPFCNRCRLSAVDFTRRFVLLRRREFRSVETDRPREMECDSLGSKGGCPLTTSGSLATWRGWSRPAQVLRTRLFQSRQLGRFRLKACRVASRFSLVS